jgi:hypothetical protein
MKTALHDLYWDGRLAGLRARADRVYDELNGRADLPDARATRALRMTADSQQRP